MSTGDHVEPSTILCDTPLDSLQLDDQLHDYLGTDP